MGKSGQPERLHSIYTQGSKEYSLRPKSLINRLQTSNFHILTNFQRIWQCPQLTPVARNRNGRAALSNIPAGVNRFIGYGVNPVASGSAAFSS